MGTSMIPSLQSVAVPTAYQWLIKESKKTGTSRQYSYLEAPSGASISNSIVREIDYKTASTIILEYEWIGTMPLPKSCRYIYGIYFDDVLGGAIVYVEPSTRQYYKTYPRQVVQLNRGATEHWTPKNTASRLIGQSKKFLKEEGVKAIIAYCTQEAGEIGTIYQACNFDYIGITSPSKTYYLDNHWVSERTLADKIAWARNKSEAWQDKFRNLPMRMLTGKYKYILFIGSNREREEFYNEYGIISHPYPKREASDEQPILRTT